MLQLRRKVRATKALIIDLDAAGRMYIELSSPDGDAISYELSQPDARRVIAELRFLLEVLAKPPLGDES